MTIARMLVWVTFGVSIAGCVAQPCLRETGRVKVDLPRLEGKGSGLLKRGNIDTDSPIVILAGNGIPIDSSGTNRISALGFANMRGHIKSQYCTIFCERTQSIDRIDSLILQQLFQPREAMVVGVGFVVVARNGGNDRHAVLDMEFGLGRTNVVKRPSQSVDEVHVIRIHIDRDVVEDDRRRLDEIGTSTERRRVIAEVLDRSLSLQALLDIIGRHPMLANALLRSVLTKRAKSKSEQVRG